MQEQEIQSGKWKWKPIDLDELVIFRMFQDIGYERFELEKRCRVVEIPYEEGNDFENIKRELRNYSIPIEANAIWFARNIFWNPIEVGFRAYKLPQDLYEWLREKQKTNRRDMQK